MKKNNITSQCLHSLNIIKNENEKQALLNKICNGTQFISILFLNYHALNICFSDKTMFESLNKSSFLLRDGIGISMMLKLSKQEPGLNMNGTDFIPEVLSNLIHRPLILIGSSTKNIESLKSSFENTGHHVLAYADGYHTHDYYLKMIEKYANMNPVILLGLGMPKQENLTLKIFDQFNRNKLIVICGGAIIDRLSGSVTRAPKLMLKMNLEWLYRLCKEPKRLFSRIVIGGMKFSFFCIYYSIFTTIKNKEKK